MWFYSVVVAVLSVMLYLYVLITCRFASITDKHLAVPYLVVALVTGTKKPQGGGHSRGAL